MIWRAWKQPPGLSRGWETDVGAAAPLQGLRGAVRRLRNGLTVLCVFVRQRERMGGGGADSLLSPSSYITSSLS